MNLRSHIKTLLSFLLILSLLLSLSACASPEETADDISVSPEASDSPESEEPPVTPEPEEEPEILYTLRITEVMPSNKSTICSPSGIFYDYLEVYNYGEETLDLNGLMLAKDTDLETITWLGAGEGVLLGNLCCIAPGEYRVLACSKEVTACLGAAITLPKDGAHLMLVTEKGTVIDEITYEKTSSDTALLIDSEKNVTATYLASPGSENTEEGFLAFQASLQPSADLIISEVLTDNEKHLPVGDKYYDLVEVKNISARTILLSDYCLSDDENDLTLYTLPEKELEPGAMCIIYCSGNASMAASRADFAPFGLNAQDERLYLSKADGTLLDYVHLHDISRYGSMGRMDAEGGWYYFEKPTPGKANTDGKRLIASSPIASVPQGVYEDIEEMVVELSGEGTIYYTTNGSVPTVNSEIYTEPFVFTRTGVIRAICVSEDKIPSPAASFSYIINEGHTLPVTSLLCNSNEMFGDNGVWSRPEIREGIYAKDCDVTYFALDGTSFSNGCRAELHGANSRNTLFKKSMKLTFGGYYGDVEYPLFENTGSTVTSFHTLTLRGGGSDRLEILRDNWACEIAENVCDTDMYTLDSQYTILYINGRYYGIYAWREAYSGQYFESHTGADKDEVQIVRWNTSGTEIGDIIRFINNHNMRDPDNYAYVSSVFDMESLAYWTAFQAFFENLDISGNIRYVKLSPDDKWRMVLYDLDYTLVGWGANWKNVINQNYNLAIALGNLLDNPDFCNTLLECTARLYHNGLDTPYVQAKLDEYLELLDPEIQRDADRWYIESWCWYTYSSWLYPYTNENHTNAWIRNLKYMTGASDEKILELFGREVD